jgi:hypothetical protein
MGVTNLWQILQPVSKPLDINDLKNKTIAVDLSIWICENSGIQYGYAGGGGTQANICTKPHLRTLFFRCKSLLELDCKLIFVREGDVIDLKQHTMKERINNRFGTKKCVQPIEATQSNETSNLKMKKMKRSHFEGIINEVLLYGFKFINLKILLLIVFYLSVVKCLIIWELQLFVVHVVRQKKHVLI